MKAVTIRNMPRELAQAVRQRAAENHTSINKAVLSLLADRLGMASKKRIRHHELDSLAGSWAPREARRFDKSLAAQRTLDPELWK